ncbi:MAG: hypothetical protein CVU98_06455 [Firmicutes bacterium HGW-Firmicutes-3]|jgi:hypothetical protein|nr:MAG: hypothetical protein CVU98_06455 [Firmicutes bacterium HGW-Firmicutes-3]
MRSFNVTIDLDEPQNSFISNPEFQIQKEVISFFLTINKSLDIRVNIQDIKFDERENKFYGELEVSGHILRGDGVRSDTLLFEVR